MTRNRTYLAAGGLLFLGSLAVHGQDIELRPVRIPNDLSYWRQSGFVEMVPPVRLPTDKSNNDVITVWVRIPDGRNVTVTWLQDQDRYTLKFPPGSVADRIETMRGEKKAMLVIDGIEDVRGATIDRDGNTRFHVYEPIPGRGSDALEGYEWRRRDAQGDDLAATSLIKLFYPGASAGAESEIRHFRTLNQCGGCHLTNQPAPTSVSPPSRTPMNLLTDSHGFFQPITVLANRMTVRSARKWDLNADDPFITVWCGSQKTTAVTDGDRRGYKCADGAVAVGEFQLSAALKAKDPHAFQVCASRAYLYRHMDSKAREAYRTAFAECSIN